MQHQIGDGAFGDGPASMASASAHGASHGSVSSRALHDSDDDFPSAEDGAPRMLQMGGSVSLFAMEGGGYAASEGFIDTDLHVQRLRDESSLPQQFSECVFKVYPRLKYDAHVLLADTLDAYNRTVSSVGKVENEAAFDVELEAHLQRLIALRDAEKSENEAEFERAAGKAVAYGQIIQLLHTKSNKFLTITVKQIAEMERHCLRVVLDPTGGEDSWFTILPRFKLRSEGEPVQLSDQVLLLNKKYNTYLHCSAAFLLGCHEVNASTDRTSWRLVSFAPYTLETRHFLKAGEDVIRIFHKEAEGYVSEDDKVHIAGKSRPTVHVMVSSAAAETAAGALSALAAVDMMGSGSVPPRGSAALQHSVASGGAGAVGGGAGPVTPGRQARVGSNSLWIVEHERSNIGGIVLYESMCRLKHTATGRYLTAIVSAPANGSTSEDGSRVSRGGSHLGNGVGGSSSGGNGIASSSGSSNGSRVQQRRRREDGGSGETADDSEVRCIFTTTSYVGDENTLFTIHPMGAIEAGSDRRVRLNALIRLRHASSGLWLHLGAPVNENTVIGRVAAMAKDGISDTVQFSLLGYPSLYDEDAYSIVPARREEVDKVYEIVALLESITSYVESLSKGGDRQALTKSTMDSVSLSRGQRGSSRAADAKKVIAMLGELIKACTLSADENPMTREGIPVRAIQDLLREQHIISVATDLLKQTFAKGPSGIKLGDIGKPENYSAFTICSLTYKLLKQIMKGNSENRFAMSEHINFIQKQISFPPATETLLETFKDNKNLLDHISDHQIYFFIIQLDRQGRDANYIKFLSTICKCQGEPLQKNQRFVCERFLVAYRKLLIETRVADGVAIDGLSVEALAAYYREDRELQVRPGADWISLEKFARDPAHASDLAYYTRLVKLLANVSLGRNARTLEVCRGIMPFHVLIFGLRNPRLPYDLRRAFCYLMLNLYVDTDPFKPIQLISLTRVWTALDRDVHSHVDIPLVTMLEIDQLKMFLWTHLVGNEVIDHADRQRNKFTVRVLELLDRMVEFGIFVSAEEFPHLVQPVLSMLNGHSDVVPLGGASRYETNDHNRFVMRLKHLACSVLDRFFDFRLDMRLTEALSLLHKKMEGGKATKAVEVEQHLSVSKLRRATMRFDIPTTELVPILEDLILYDSTELARSAAALMVRFYNQQRELQDALQNVQILVTERNVSTYEFVASQLNEVRHLLGSFSASSCDPIVRILRALKNLCVKYNTPFSHNQRILRNLDAQTVVFELLHAPFDPRALGTSAARQELAEAVFDLMGAFCLENADNQACLFEYLDEFILLLPDFQSVAATLAQVFRNNRSLCSQITEGQLRKIVNTIASGCRFPRFLRLLETLTMVNGRPVRRNQALVLKMLMEQQADTLVLFNDPESAQERNRLISEGDFRLNPNSVLMYHRLLIDLITSCAAGKIYEAEIKAQALYSVHDIAQHLTDPSNLRDIKAAFVHFLHEVYFLTEKRQADIELDPSVWMIFGSHFLPELLLACDEEVDEWEEVITYVCSTVLEFLVNFFGNYFQLRKASMYRDLCMRMLDCLCVLFRKRNEFISQTQHLLIGHCIHTMKQTGLMADHENVDSALMQYAADLAKPVDDMEGDYIAIVSREDEVYEALRAFVKHLQKSFPTSAGTEVMAKAMFDRLDTVTRRLLTLLQIDVHVHPEIAYNVLKSLRSILEKRILEEPTAEDDQRLERLQCQLSGVGLTNLVTCLISESSHDFIVQEALRVGIALLHGGNIAIQKYILELTGGGIAASGSEFFHALRSRIRRSVGEIKDRQQWFIRLLERRRAQEAEESHGNVATAAGEPSGGTASAVLVASAAVPCSALDTAAAAALQRSPSRSGVRLNAPPSPTSIMSLIAGYEATPMSDSIAQIFGGVAVGSSHGAVMGLHGQIASAAAADAGAVLVTSEAIDALQDEDDQFPETGYIWEVLRFLQLLCEGHYLSMQRHLLFQPNSIKSYDLVSEVAYFLEALDREVDATNIRVATQVFITLTEFVQGPCPENQMALIRTKLCESVNWVVGSDYPGCNPDDVNQLKEQCLLTLVSILEGVTSSYIPRQMIHLLNFRAMIKNLASLLAGESDSDLVFMYYFVLRTIGDYDRGVSELLQAMIDETPNSSWLIARTGRIEINRSDRLERVYFRIPDVCKLSEKSKHSLLWSVDRTNHSDKIEDFFNRSDRLISEMQHRSELSTHSMFSRIYQQEHLLKDVFFALSWLINFLVVVAYTSQGDNSNVDAPFYMRALIMIVGCGHLVLGCMLFWLIWNYQGKLITSMFWKAHPSAAVSSVNEADTMGDEASDGGGEALRAVRERSSRHRSSGEVSEAAASSGSAAAMAAAAAPPQHARWSTLDDVDGSGGGIFYALQRWAAHASLLRIPDPLSLGWLLLRDSTVLYGLLSVLFSVLGLLVTPFFFAFHLLEVVPRSELLKYVIKSVTLNGKSIVLTTVLAAIIVYMYSILAFLYFRDQFNEDHLGACTTMLQCLVNVVSVGLRNGEGVGAMMESPEWGKTDTPWRIVYDTTFFFLVIVILLNIVFGIIIDTFGELRGQNKSIEEDIANRCFVCGIDRFTFDRHSTVGFERHIREDHNMWHYLFLKVYLMEKDHTEFTGPEQYVYDLLVDQRDYSFVPNLKALCLTLTETDEDARLDELVQAVRAAKHATAVRLAGLSQGLSSVESSLQDQLGDLAATQNSRLDAAVGDLLARLGRVEKDLQSLRRDAGDGRSATDTLTADLHILARGLGHEIPSKSSRGSKSKEDSKHSRKQSSSSKDKSKDRKSVRFG